MFKSLKVLFLPALALLVSLAAAATPIKKEINSGWQFKQGRGDNWYPATVPGVIHTDLMANGIIEDPFFRLNIRSVQWVDKEDWMYATRFDVDSDTFGRDSIRLHFMGLDTYADIYLNGQKLAETDNMFREWKVDIKPYLKEKDNKLEVYFNSPIKRDIPKWDALPFQYPTGPDQSQEGGIFNKTVSTFARKAGYHYGWDWGPRLVTSGIWRPVYLEAWNDVKIDNVFIQQKEVTARAARITAHAELVATKDESNVKITIKDKNSGVVYGSTTQDLKTGVNTVAVDFTINNPRLWWSNGLGEPNLYEFTTVVELNSSAVADAATVRTGIRSIRVVNEPDKYGTSLYFELNGVKVFAKGANYVPADNFLPRVTKEKHRQTIQAAVDVNMNMLRVWGGGTYEEDYFYDLCDENGILVWQDFMFACGMYPSEGRYLETTKQEAIDNIKRLRNHPAIALWCGNNESYDGWFGWGRREDFTRQNPEYARIMWKQYTDLFHQLLPDMVDEYAPGMCYRPSSPYGLPGQDNNATDGDRHYWGIWHGREPIANYNTVRSRFFSEYGFQSFPEFESVKIFAPQERDWGITTEVMMDHQRAGAYANNLINEYLLKEYQQPKDFEAFLYMNQVLQGDAIKIAMEAHRRDMPYCMGTLFWQHNDSWPTASWSSRDYYGRWKAQHYFARNAYRDVLVSPIMNGDKLDVYVVSDRQKSSKATLTVQTMKLDGTIIYSRKLNINIPKNTSERLLTLPLTELLKGTDKKDVVVHAKLTENAGKLTRMYDNNYFLLQQKDVDYPQVTITRSIRPVEDGFEVSLTTDNFARAVFLSINGIDNFFGDNYFDILPGQTKTVKVTTPLSQAEFEGQLKVVSLRDGYK